MKFSEWSYTRPDYSEIKTRICDCKNGMEKAMSYQVFRDAWLDVKKEIDYMEFQEETIYIRHLCGMDYQYGSEEVEIHYREDPSVYKLCDECDRIAVTFGYCNGRKREDDAGTVAIC